MLSGCLYFISNRRWPETGFFREYFAAHRKNYEKPGFLDLWGGEKPGFFENTSPHLVESAKNPVSLPIAGPETGFFENYSLSLVEVAKNPVSSRL